MKNMARLAVVCAAVLALACDTTPRTETAADTDATIGTTGVSEGHREFVEESLAAGMAEVELARLAQQRAASSEVKQFADMMIRDHTKAGDELKQIANRHSIEAPAQLEQEHRELMERLSDLRGEEFDRAYMDAMVDSHQDVVAHLRSRADVDRYGDNKGAVAPEQSDNPVEASLNQWAANALPTTRHHLDEARRLDNMLGNRLTRQ